MRRPYIVERAIGWLHVFICRLYIINKIKQYRQGACRKNFHDCCPMDIVAQNPYRYLGVYSNSPIKERVANKTKMNAFLRVGKSVSFPLDLPHLLPSINRTLKTISDAEASLTLPIDQIRFAQFWWLKIKPLDTVAFNHLLKGDVDMAISIWEKKENVSSLQNRFVLFVINKDWEAAMRCAEVLYSSFSEEFMVATAGKTVSISTPLWQILINSLAQAGVEIQSLIDVLSIKEWKNHILEAVTAPLQEAIYKAIDVTKSSRGEGTSERLEVGKKLIASTRDPLRKLKSSLPLSDIRYQTVADKLAIEILQCGIDFYNQSEDIDSIEDVIEIAKYAYTVAEGGMAKQRCKENVDILQKKKDRLPPASVRAEYKITCQLLQKYDNLPETVSNAKQLLQEAKPHLQTMKTKLGATHPGYLNISTQVVNCALHNVIEEVNREVSKVKSIELQTRLAALWTILKDAWSAIELMDKFDMQQEFKNARYLENRTTLRKMYQDTARYLGYSVFHSSDRVYKTSSPKSKPSPPKDKTKIYKKIEDYTGWIIAVILYIIGFVYYGFIFGAILYGIFSLLFDWLFE